MDRIYFKKVAIGDIEKSDGGQGYWVKSYYTENEWFAHNKKWAVESLKDEAKPFDGAKPEFDPIGDLTSEEIERYSKILGVPATL